MIASAATPFQGNLLVNQADSTGTRQGIINAIRTAANQTGVDFSYLLKKASQESSLNPDAKASGSSATGLYQFTKQTWLQTVKNYGNKYNLGAYADHISTDNNGVAHVKDPAWKQAILNLRKDPTAAAEMAGELDRENQTSLQANVGGKIGGTELYLAHFLGAGGATAFLNEMHQNPKEEAAEVLPDAAAANPAVFYGKDGTPRSLQQIYQHFAQRFDAPSVSSTVVASVAPRPAPAITTTKTQTAAAAPASNLTVASYTPTASTSLFGLSDTKSSASSSNGLKFEGSSLFATMILAQMKDDTTTSFSDSLNPSGHKKNPYEGLNLGSVS